MPSISRRVSWISTLAVAASITACGGDDAPANDAASAVDAPTGATDAAPDALASPCPAPTPLPIAGATELTVGGDVGSTMGIFDPSVVYPAGAPAGAMSYSSVPDQHTIRTRIAVSADAGATWGYIAEANVPEPATLASTDATECPGGACTGLLISEVSSLVIDPDDPSPQRRWKLFAHRYLVEPDDTLHYRLGTITLQTAPAPEGPWTAPAKLLGWNSPSPYTSTGAALNVNTVPATADCLALTEPGALWRPGAIELAVGCVYLDGATPRIRVELFRSGDHATTWSRVSTLLGAGDGACLDPSATPSVNAAALFFAGGAAYVVATPSTATGYTGCLIYPVDDLVAGAVRRDALGRAMPSRIVVPEPARFAGACSYAEGATGLGLAVSTGYFESARRFRILRAAVTP